MLLKDMLLQILIALLPVFIFLIWHDRPERTRYAKYFFGIICGLSMLLSMRYSVQLEGLMRLDLRFVPLIAGSLYGGIPTAASLCVLYAAAELPMLRLEREYLMFAAHMLGFFPVLFGYTLSFQHSLRPRRLKITYKIIAAALGFQAMSAVIYLYDQPLSMIDEMWRTIALFAALFVFATIACIHFTEVSFERVQLQTQLREVSHKYRSETRRLQQFIDDSPMFVLFVDGKGHVTQLNDMALRLIQPFVRKDVLNRPYEGVLQKLELEYGADPVERVMNGEERVTDMLRIRGKTYYTVASAVKGTTTQGYDGVLLIGHDVTELQQLKDEVGRMERLSLVGQMAASITHEIRNPMAVIRGFVQLLNERSPGEQQSYFRIVIDELDRANGIINDFLSLAQNRIVPKEPCHLHDILLELQPLLWADANMRGQIIEMQLAEGVDTLEMNSKEIKQLILNLARNGMEAMTDKGVLRIETYDLKDIVQLRVIDHGVGIPQEKLERLFEPFFTTKTSGTGLGLALCLSIVERHNGKIHVESVVGQGTTFIVSFCKPGRVCW